MASTYEGVSDQNYIKLNKIIFFAESEPKTEPDADCHDDPKTGVLFNKIFDLYLHCVIFLSDCPKWKEENGGCSWSEWRDMCKKTCGLCGIVDSVMYFHRRVIARFRMVKNTNFF